MFDLTKFKNNTEFYVVCVVMALLFLSELVIWIYTAMGNSGNEKKRSDAGTVWLIILGWWCGIGASVFFRSRGIPEMIRGWLLPHFFCYIGIALILCGTLVRCDAVWTLKRAFTLTVQTTGKQHLIQTGLYHIVRNPAYLGSIMSLLGVAFVYRHMLGTLCVLLLCLVCYGVRIHVEERALKEQFKEEFEQYCRETKYKVIPGLY